MHGLSQIVQLIGQLPQEQAQIKNACELINSALIQCEEAIDEMQQFAERIQLDPERLHQIETRMSTIHQLARKYHIDSSQLHESCPTTCKKNWNIYKAVKVN